MYIPAFCIYMVYTWYIHGIYRVNYLSTSTFTHSVRLQLSINTSPITPLILYKHPNDIKWVPYNAKHVVYFKEVHHDKDRGVSTFQIVAAKQTFTRERKIRYHDDMIQILIIRHNVQQIQAHAALHTHQSFIALDPEINPDRPPKTFNDAMSRKYKDLWAAAFNKEYRPQPRIKRGSTSRRRELKRY